MELLLVVVLLAAVSSSSAANFCDVNTFGDNTGTHMQFTKETNSMEYAVLDQFKDLHCCVKGATSIEWFKDGEAYPFTTSDLIILPWSINQTIYTKKVSMDDAGTYLCRIRNGSVVIDHTIHLQVLDKVPDDPKVTFASGDKEVGVGEELRLFCEAFAVPVNLPDAHNEVTWTKTGYNGTLEANARVQMRNSTRESENNTFGTYLIIDKVTPEDFGEYVCVISKTGRHSITKNIIVREKQYYVYISTNPVPVRQLLILLAVIVLAIVILVALLQAKCFLKLRVACKDQWGPTEATTDNIHDAIIMYNDKDAELALGVLLPTLEHTYNYRCASRSLPDSPSMWYSEMKAASTQAKRLLVLISPGCLPEESWDGPSVLQLLKQIQPFGAQACCCVTLSPLPVSAHEPKNGQGETLASVARAMGVLPWERSRDEGFWLELRLRLPPVRPTTRRLIMEAV